jgi:hypothetical protein
MHSGHERVGRIVLEPEIVGEHARADSPVIR